MKNFQRHAEPYLGKAAVIEKKIISRNIETHWHSFYEFEFIVSGECEFVINGKSYEGKAGDMFIFNLSDFHDIRLKSETLELYTLQFVIDYINDTLLSFLLHNEAKKLTFKGEKLETISYLLALFTKEFEKNRTFHEEYAKSLGYKYAVRGAFSKLISCNCHSGNSQLGSKFFLRNILFFS